MSRRSRRTRETPPEAPVVDEDIGSFAQGAMRIYGTAVNEDRSIPALEDGLKPVARRSIWAATAVAGTAQVKSARLVGDIIGKYHPHGDVSSYGAVTTLVNSNMPPITGVGNWGTLLDPAAAMRYTNVVLSKYGHTFLRKEYLAVSPLCPNFDETCSEPIVLPALLPNILINGGSGIGVGVTTDIPSFSAESLLTLLIKVLDGEKVPPASAARILKLYDTWGGKPTQTTGNFKQLVALMTDSKATIQFDSPLTVLREQKTIQIDRFAPGLALDTFVAKVRALTSVKSVTSGKGLSFVIKANPATNFNEFDSLVRRIESLARTSLRYSIYVSERVPTGDGKFSVGFHRLGVLPLLSKWLKWRLALEVSSLEWRAEQLQKRITYLSLLLHAAKPGNLKIIFDALQRPNTAELIARGLKITLEEAEVILNLKVRSLSKLDVDALSEERAQCEAKRKLTIAQSKRPRKVVRDYFVSVVSQLKRAPRDPELHNKVQTWIK